MAMDATTLELDGSRQQLWTIAQQYRNVEQERETIAEELKSVKKKRRKLAAEVRFLHEKLRSFQRVPILDGPSQMAHHLKHMEAPQFYEVEVKFANSLGSGMMDCMGFEYPSNPKDFQNEYAPDLFV